MARAVTVEELQEAIDAVVRNNGNVTHAAREVGIARSTLHDRYLKALRQGIKADPQITTESSQYIDIEPDLITLLKKRPRGSKSFGYSLGELAEKFDISQSEVAAVIESMASRGINIQSMGGLYAISKDVDPTFDAGKEHAYISRKDNTYLFGFTGDNHLCSKYERLDCLNALYDAFAEAGVDRVLNAGNWIDGEARFNKFDLHTHGMDAQLQYLAENYPIREGIKTYAICGDDHEGWYSKSSGVDIGRYASNTMADNGRDDWINLGYMESYIPLVNKNTGQSAQLLLMHPGGGSSYAISYTSQKIVESFEGGEKPAIVLLGHYHKMNLSVVRNVWTLQTGTTQDQTPFMRKKKLAAHVGGGICKVTQDPNTGAITRCQVEFIQFFNRGYYNDRWSMSGDVVLPERS